MNDNIINTLFLTDSYKISHHLQYPPDTTKLFSYFESRGGKWDKTLFFGLQIILKKYLSGVVVTQQMIEEADIFFREHFGTDILALVDILIQDRFGRRNFMRHRHFGTGYFGT